MNNTTEHTARTKLDMRSKNRIVSAITINWADISETDIQELASRSIIIQWQNECRKAGSVPETANLNASAYRPGAPRAPRGPQNPMALFAKMTPEEQRSFLELAAASLAAAE